MNEYITLKLEENGKMVIFFLMISLFENVLKLGNFNFLMKEKYKEIFPYKSPILYKNLRKSLDKS
ncbi:MAG: hypothetical protein ACTSQP_05740 [Promethearchaeota archaeon]